MKKQLIFDKNGMLIKTHDFGWVSLTCFVCKLKVREPNYEKIIEVE